MLLILLIVVLCLGGGGFWGYRSGRLAPDASLSWVVLVIVALVIILGGLGPHYHWYDREPAPPMFRRS